MYVPDNYDQWKAHDADEQKWLDSRPICADCDHPIQDETAFHINGEFICENCMEAYRVYTEDYIE